MDRDLIQQELDSLATKFDNTPDKFLSYLDDHSKFCSRCGRTVIRMETHEPTCIKLHAIALEIIKVNQGSLSVTAICNKHRLGASSRLKVSEILKYLGHVPAWTKHVETYSSRISTAVANNPNMSRAEIAQIVGISPNAVGRWHNKQNVVMKRKGPKLAQYHDQIFSLYNSGKSFNAIADILGLCYMTVTRYIRANSEHIKRIG